MQKSVVIVHDFLVTLGGAERVAKELLDMFPDAPIYTLLYDEAVVGKVFPKERVRTSMVQKLPRWMRRRYRWLLPLFASAIEAMDLREYDVVISSSGAWSKGVVTKLKTKHLAYVHSPMRFVWDYNERYPEMSRGSFSFLRRFFLGYARVWDRLAADRPDKLVANSEYTRRRIEKYYRRPASVVYPPVSLGERFDGAKLADESLRSRGYFLVVSRMTKSKNVSIVVEAFGKLRFPLVVIGTGYDEKVLRKNASGNVFFLGSVSDETLARYMAKARALLFPAEDDFGIVSVEAMQMGTPVIALRKGGVSETVRENEDGIFFDAPVSVAVADAVRRFLEHGMWDAERIRAHAAEFSRARFREGIARALEEMEEKGSLSST